MKILPIILLLCLSQFIQAKVIDKCGTYHAEGYYTEIESDLHNQEKKKVILLERGSNSEITFYITNSDTQYFIQLHPGLNFIFELTFESSCYYHCEGKIKKVLSEAIHPSQGPKRFLSPVKPLPLPGTEIPCKPNPFEDTDLNSRSPKQPISPKK